MNLNASKLVERSNRWVAAGTMSKGDKESSCYGYHLIVEIGSVEGGAECDWLRHTQDLLTVPEDAAGCCGCEAEQGGFGELPLQNPQKFIIYSDTHESVSS